MNINTELNNLMKSYIKTTNHNDSGSLSSSIKFNAKLTDDGFLLGLEANNYILYLDDGNFIEDFLGLPKVGDVISTFIVDEMLKDL